MRVGRAAATAVLPAVLALGLLGGCRDDLGGAADGGARAVPAVDPLSGVESDLDAIERDLDADLGG